MKNCIVLGLFLISLLVHAQETVRVEENLNSVQLGLLSLSYQNEIRLDRKLTLRSELGLMTGIVTKNGYFGQNENSFLILPFINIEPRYYYGLDRRSRLNRKVVNNNSNYFSLLTSFISSRTALVNTKDFEAAPALLIIPQYGIRRSYGEHFFSESAAGIGYQHNLHKKSYFYTQPENKIVFNLQLKVGYIF